MYKRRWGGDGTVRWQGVRWLAGLVALVLPAAGLAVTSDDFHASSLDTALWEVVDPRGDGAVSVNGTQLTLSVPAGVSHDIWKSGNHALRVMQEVADADLDVEVKFESALSARYQLQGLLVEQDSSNFVRTDVYHDGSSLRIFAATFTAGQPTVHVQQVIGNAQPVHLRVIRQGSNWTVAYAYDGLNWTTAGSFSHSLNVVRLGPFAGNAGNNPPSHTALVDFVFDVAAPIEPEDGGGIDTLAPVISNLSEASATNSIDLAWTTNEPATSVVRYGQTSGLEIGAQTATSDGSGTSHDATVTGLAADTTYYYRVEAEDAGGNVGVSEVRQLVTGSPATVGDGPAIEVWYGDTQSFGHNGRPQRWVNVLGRVTDPDGVSSLSYSLNGGSHEPLAIGPDDRRLEAGGDFNVEVAFTELAPGSNDVTIRATDGLGNVASRSVTVNTVDGTDWSLPTTIDWNGSSSILDTAQVVDGHWTVDGESARPVALGYDRLIAFGEMTWKDYEVVVPVTIHGLDPGGYAWPSNGPGLGVIMRWTGHYDRGNGAQPRDGWWPLGALAWYRWPTENSSRFEMMGNEGHWLDTNKSRTLDFGVPYYFKARVETPSGQGSIYRLKVWPQSEPEPMEWDLEAQETTSDPQFGSAVLVAHHVDASFGDVIVSPVAGGGSDDTPPGIAAVNVVAGETSAEVSWSTDEAADSLVRYGETTAYELGSIGAGDLVTTHGLWVPGLTAGTQYHFQVQSTDAAGNTATSGDFTFTTGSGSGATGGVSDTFDGDSLDPLIWTVEDPLGDSSITVTNGELRLAVPAGVEHDVWRDGVDAPRVMQTVTDTSDLVVEVKFDSVPAAAYQMQGILVEQAAGADFIRFDYYHDGSSLRLFAASFTNGRPTVRHDVALPSGSGIAPLYLRVTRAGSSWTHEYALGDGGWQVAGSFDHDLVVTGLGVFAGNAGPGAPAFEARVDHFSVNGSGSGGVPADNTAPVISGVTASGAETSINVAWATDEPATSLVRYGETNSHELGLVSDGAHVTTHDLTIPGLDPGTAYHYRIESTDQSGNTSVHSGTVSTTDTGGGGIASHADEFDGATLDPAWTIEDPVGDSTVSVSSGQLHIAVPGGTDHDVWKSGVDAPRIVRPVADDPALSVEVKFESVPTEQYQLQGVLVNDLPGWDFIRFDVYSDGRDLHAFAATFVNGRPTVRYAQAITSGMASGPLYLRVSRSGDDWLQEYSYDGINWQAAASFTYAQAVSGLAVFAGNAGGNPPAFDAAIDYVR